MRKTRFAGMALVAMTVVCGGAVGCGEPTEDAQQTENGVRLSPFPVSEKTIDEAKRSGDPKKIAEVLHAIASDRTALPTNSSGVRVERMKRLFDGEELELVRKARAEYIASYDEDPEITIRSDGLFRPLLRLDRSVELEMVGALNGAQMAADAAALKDMFQRAGRGSLTRADRERYFAMLPRMGLWSAPVRAASKDDSSLDAMERTLLVRAMGGDSRQLEATLEAIEAKLPPAKLAAPADRSKSVAVVASSHGAQWQELMGWAMAMDKANYHLQVFTPEGRPVAFQRDSLSVSVHTVKLGFGAPTDLDPAGEAGSVAARLLSNTASAASFDPTAFGAVYLAGGLGFNEDVAIATPGDRGRTVLTAAPNIARMMQRAIDEKLPLVAICHGPTLFATPQINIDGEPVNKGIPTASLPPFESYVGRTERKEIQFTYDVNTHEALEATGGETSVLADIANMRRVVQGRKSGIDIVTGPGPQAASFLAPPTMEKMRARWGR